MKRMPFDAGAARLDHAPPRLPRRLRRRSRHASSTWTRSAAPACASASIRWAAPACTTGARSPSATASTSTVVNDAVDPDLPLHDRRLGRQDPHGPVVAVRDAAPDRAEGPLRHRLRLRHRPRPPRHRHQEQRACCRPITTCRCASHYLFRHRPQLARRRRGRQDGGQQQHDRSRRRQARPHGCTRCRSASSGSSTACWTGRSASAARRAPAPRSCAATAASGRPTRTASSPACSRPRSPRALGRDPGEVYRELTREFGDPVYERIDAPATPAQKAALAKLVAGAACAPTELAGETIQRDADHRARQRRRRSAA